MAFLSDFEHLRGRHKRELFPDAKYIQARNEQQEKFKNEAVRRFEDALRPWEAYGLEEKNGLMKLFRDCSLRHGFLYPVQAGRQRAAFIMGYEA